VAEKASAAGPGRASGFDPKKNDSSGSQSLARSANSVLHLGTTCREVRIPVTRYNLTGLGLGAGKERMLWVAANWKSRAYRLSVRGGNTAGGGAARREPHADNTEG